MMTAHPTQATEDLRAARDFLLEHREDYATAIEKFEWPRPRTFNWGLEWFDVIATRAPRSAGSDHRRGGRDLPVVDL